MLSGELSQEQLSQTLRELSQKKRHGILQIDCTDRKLEIIFSAGKIVDCQSTGEVKTKALLARIVDLGLVPSDALEQEFPDTYQALFTVVKEHSSSISIDDFKELLTHWIQDKLYNINFDRQGQLDFIVKVPEFERGFATSISVGQLLLDLVALHTDYADFDQELPASAFLVKVSDEESDAPGDLSSDEELLYAAIGKGVSRANLRKRIYLSEYPFREALVSLRDKGLIEISLNAPSESAAGTSRNTPPSLIAQPQALLREEIPAKAPANKEPSLAHRLNHYLLHSSLVPEVMVIVFLASALVIPLLFWKAMFLQF